MSNCLLQGAEAPICQPNQISEGFLPTWVHSFDCYTLLLFHVGREDTDKEKVDSIKRHYQGSGAGSQGSEGSSGFFLNPDSNNKGCQKSTNKTGLSMNFGFYHHQGFKLRRMENGQSNQQSCEGVTDRVPEKKSLVM